MNAYCCCSNDSRHWNRITKHDEMWSNKNDDEKQLVARTASTTTTTECAQNVIKSYWVMTWQYFRRVLIPFNFNWFESINKSIPIESINNFPSAASLSRSDCSGFSHFDAIKIIMNLTIYFNSHPLQRFGFGKWIAIQHTTHGFDWLNGISGHISTHEPRRTYVLHTYTLYIR